MTTRDPKWRFSRSHQVAYKICPKYYYLRFHEGGTGYERKVLGAGVTKGSLAHSCLQRILTWVKTHDLLPSADVVREVFATEKVAYKAQLEARGLEDVETEFLQQEFEVSSALVEGAVRAWLKVRLPILLEKYKVIDVEREIEVQISDDGIVVMCRPDATLQDRASNGFVPLEFKTTSVNFDDYFESWGYATQILVHLLATREAYGQIGDGVQMEFIYLGYHKRDKLSGQTIYYSPLVRAYIKRGNPPFNDDEYAWGGDYSRKSAWSVFNVWEHTFDNKPEWMTTMEYWVEHVLDHDALSQHLFTKTIYRNDADIQEWTESATQIQRKIYQGVQVLASTTDAEIVRTAKACFFPGNKDEHCFSNKYHRRCEFLPYCYHEVDNLDSCGLYVKREPHHEQEFEV